MVKKKSYRLEDVLSVSKTEVRIWLKAFPTTKKELDPVTKRCLLRRRSPPARVCACVYFRLHDCVRVTSGILVPEYSSRGVFEKDQDDAWCSQVLKKN